MSPPARGDDAAAHEAAAITLAEYDRMSEAYRHGTADHDVSQNIAALLDAIEGAPPHVILDLGCGPGRDLHAFAALGHEVVGLEGAAGLVALARAESDCTVLHQDFLALDLPPARFDGIFANASLFHVPSSQIARVLAELAAALKPRGALFCSNPRGDNQEGWGRRALRLLLRPGDLARPRHRRGLHRASPLLPAARPPAPPAALARHGLAQERNRAADHMT